MTTVQYWVTKARKANIFCIWPFGPRSYQAAKKRRDTYMSVARLVKANEMRAAKCC